MQEVRRSCGERVSPQAAGRACPEVGSAPSDEGQGQGSGQVKVKVEVKAVLGCSRGLDPSTSRSGPERAARLIMGTRAPHDTEMSTR